MKQRMFVCYSRKEITEEFLKSYEEEIKTGGFNCSKCGAKLKVGDYVDGFYPYETEYNICKKCEIEERKGYKK